ncbi:hypothetical protein [Streptomyces griseus]|uniref:hypothetical protein n=1 Tax=Streptomyces griseus TaxID=1911 RepID=UPI003865ABBF
MDTQHDIALTRALAQVPGPLPSSGVIHVVIPHTGRFTIVGNHLAQHAELSLTAIGIGVHFQSLPAGSKVGTKALAARFPEGETKIASALRELENHGYLHRPRMRLANGWVVTRTVFRNQPAAVGRGGAVVGPEGAWRCARAHCRTEAHRRAGTRPRTGADTCTGARPRTGADTRTGADHCAGAHPLTGRAAAGWAQSRA